MMAAGILMISGVGINNNQNDNKGEKNCNKMFGKDVKHFPRLDTVIMVEEAIRKYGPITKTKLSQKLKKKVMWPTLTLILDYFESMGFTMKDNVGKIVWIYDPDFVKKYRSREDLEWEPG